MTKIYLAICRGKFYLYDEKREPLYLDGEKFFEYETNKIREAARRLTEKILDENNLTNDSELKFFVIENSDAALNESFSGAQGGLIAERYSLNELLRRTVRELAKNPKLYVHELGINYDGKCYGEEKNLLIQSDYSLLALTIEPSELLKFVD